MTETLDGRPGSASCIRIPDKSSLLLVFWIVALAFGSVTAQSVPQSAPPPNRNITAPGPQPHAPQTQRQPVSPAAAAPQPTRQIVGNGTIEGFVYWDTSAISHVPAGDCTGLAVNVAVAQSSTGPYTSMATLSNNFTYAGQVKQFLVGGKIKVYDVCTYGYGKVPVGLNLQVTVNVTSPTAFSPISVPQNSIVSPVNIINAQCNMLPRIVNPTASDLFSKWGTCQNMAFDVNFEITKASQSLSSSGGAQRGTGGAQVPKGPGGTTLLTGTGKPALLNGTGSTPSQTQSASGRQSQPSSGRLLGNNLQGNSASATRQTYTGNTRPSTPGSKVELNPQPFPPKQVLTNHDVLTMLNARLAESVILSSLQSSQHKFDFSAASCRELQRAHVTANILNAMGDGSVRPCPTITGNAPLATPGAKVELNPQPLSPRTSAASGSTPPNTKVAPNREQMLASLKKPSPGTRAAVAPQKVAAPKALKKVTNPRLAEQNAGIIAMIEQQRQAAEQESAAMGAGTRAIASSASARTPVLAANLQGNAVQGLGPQQVQSSGTLNSQITHVSPFNGIVILCANDPTPRIVQVNGGQGHGTMFTPEAKYNLYTITGCSFGPSRSGNKAYIFEGSFTANLNIDFWSDNGITAHLDPWLAGVVDQDNVTLVVAPAIGRGIQQSGFKFYAARGMPRVPDKTPEEVPLAYNSVPQSYVKLSSVTDVQNGWDNVPSNATSAFPSFSFQGTPVAGWAFRYAYGHDDSGNFLREFDPTTTLLDYYCWINGDAQHEVGGTAQDPCSTYFTKINHWTANLWGPIGADQWTIPISSAFVISSYNLYYDDTDASQICGAFDDSSKDSGHVGNWDFNLTGPDQIQVSWPLYWCFDQEAWPFNRLNGQRQSAYGLAVWVWGPRCVDPYTDKPDQPCMNKVKKIYGG
jgi:hypothetical protein